MKKDYNNQIEEANKEINTLKEAVNKKLPYDLDNIRVEAKKTNSLIKL